MTADRITLPQRRANETFDIRHEGIQFVVTLGFYRNGKIGEVFITGPKAGSHMDGIARDAAVLLSLALQHRVPLDTIAHAITRNADATASTVIGRIVDKMRMRFA